MSDTATVLYDAPGPKAQLRNRITAVVFIAIVVAIAAFAIGLYTQTTSLAVTPKLHDVWIEKSQGEPVFADARFVR